MAKVIKLTPAGLRKMVLEEKEKYEKNLVTEAAKRKAAAGKKLNEAEEMVPEKPREVEADEYADTLDNKIDYMKALKIKEQQLKKQLNALKETQNKVRSQIVKKLG